MFKTPPEVNGVMELTEEQVTDITIKLREIIESFEPSDEEPVLSLHNLVASYNDKNDFKINGDTAASLEVL